MTSPSVSWTDRKAIASLVDKLADRGERAQHARKSGAEPWLSGRIEPATVASSPDLKLPDTGIIDRLDALIAWVPTVVRTRGHFVADENGLTLASFSVSDALVSVVGPLLASLDAIRAIPGVDASVGSLRVSDDLLHWVEVNVGTRSFCLGVMTTESVPQAVLLRLQAALRETMKDF